MTFLLAALAICVVDNIAANVCRVVVTLVERREAGKKREKSGGPEWHDAKTDPPRTPGSYYGKVDDTNHMYSVLYREGAWVLKSYPQTEMDILQWAEVTGFVEVENDD